MIIRDLLYPAEWAFRFFIVAMLTRVATPFWFDVFPFEGIYCVFVIAGAGALVLQVWVAVKFFSSNKQEDIPQHH